MGNFTVVGSGAWRSAKSVHVVGSGAWRSAKEVWVVADGAWRKAWSSFTASASPNPMSDHALIFPDEFRPVTSLAVTTVTATPSDGVTYSWSHISGNATFAPTGNQCRVSFASRVPGTRTGTVQCVVSRAGTSVTLTIPYTLTISEDF